MKRFFDVWIKRGLAVVGVAAFGWAVSDAAHADEMMRSLLAQCAPDVHWSTMSAIVNVESAGRAFALADAGPLSVPYSKRKNMVRSYFPSTLPEAAQLARDLIANGHTVSLGLAQVNDRNLDRYGLTIEQVLDPCTNLATGAKILTAFYNKAAEQFGEGARALQAAISAYNSGSFERGVTNGYVRQVYAAAGVVPALSIDRPGTLSTRPIRPSSIRGARMLNTGAGGPQFSREAMLRAGADSPLSDAQSNTNNDN